jgi:hypothetical protein
MFPPSILRSLGMALSLGVAATGCAWHRIDPPRVERPAIPMRVEVVGLRATDDATSLDDLRTISKLWTTWGAFRTVRFPYRDGDPVDAIIDIRLRQTTDVHRTANLFKGFTVGLSLFTLSPVLGASFSEIHLVRVECRRGAAAPEPFETTVRTDLEIGYGADATAAAKDLDGAQLEAVAARVLESVDRACLGPGAVLHPAHRDPNT